MTTDDNIPSFDDIMSAARRWHYSEVRSIADEAIKECLKACDDPSDRREWLTEWVDDTTDGHEHVIYTGQAAMLLAASDNDEEWSDLYDGADVPSVSTRACIALRADVWEVLEARTDEWETPPADEEEG